MQAAAVTMTQQRQTQQQQPPILMRGWAQTVNTVVLESNLAALLLLFHLPILCFSERR